MSVGSGVGVSVGTGVGVSLHQAEASGFTRGLLAYHTKAGRFARIRRGLYRFPEYPRSANEAVIAAWLSVGKDSTVVSHLSALHVLKLTDSRPDVVHLTVPRSRRNLPRIAGVKIHTSVRPIDARDLADCNGLPVTGAVRSILDSIESGAPASVTEQGVVRAIRNGATSVDGLRAAARERGRRAVELVDRALAVVARPARRRPSAPAAPGSGPRTSDAPPVAGDRMAELMKHLSTFRPPIKNCCDFTSSKSWASTASPG